jgi:hypothetical protein
MCTFHVHQMSMGLSAPSTAALDTIDIHLKNKQKSHLTEGGTVAALGFDLKRRNSSCRNDRCRNSGAASWFAWRNLNP